MSEENKNENVKTPIEEKDIGKAVGGNDPFKNLPKIKNKPVDGDVTENG